MPKLPNDHPDMVLVLRVVDRVERFRNNSDAGITKGMLWRVFRGQTLTASQRSRLFNILQRWEQSVP